MSEPVMSKPQKSGTIAAQAYLEALHDNGVDALYAVAGTDFPSIVEAYGRAGDSVQTLPKAYTVPHENLAVAMAHGHALQSGKPQVAMVHVSVGTANMVCGALNAIRDGVPVLLSAGRTPLTEDGPEGTRTRFIHWAQEMFDQGGMIREAVKWDYELRHPEQVEDVVVRALDIACAPPPGPVYLSLPREILAMEVKPDRPRRRRSAVSQPMPDPDAMERLASAIRKAEHPLIVTSNVGRDPDAAATLAALCELWAIPVVQFNARSVNLPYDHSMAVGFDTKDIAGHADLILSIACDVPWIPKVTKPRPQAPLYEIEHDPLFSRYPMRSFPAQESIIAAPGPALSTLAAILGEPGESDAIRVERRRGHVRQMVEKRRAATKPDLDSFTADSASEVMARHMPANAIVVNEYSFRADRGRFRKPGQFFGFTPAGGLGFGFGAALGVAAAGTDGPVIVMLGDGAYMFNNPTACHWAAAAHKLPILTVLFNNRRWGAVRNSTLAMYPQGAAAADDGMFLADLSPSPDYGAICRAHGGFGERVEKLDDLPAAFSRALDAVAKGQQALLDLYIAP